MIIDFHTHIFPNVIAGRTVEILEKRTGLKLATDATLNVLLQSMEAAGVGLSVILPVMTKPSQFETVNSFAQSVNEKYQGKLLSFGGIHPDCEDYKGKLRKIKDMGLPGIKLHPDYQGVWIDDIRYMNIIDYASELGLIITTHAGLDAGFPEPIHCPPDKMRKVVDAIKPEKMIVAHYGGWKQWDMVYEYLADADVYFDTAVTFGYIEQDMFLKIWEKHNKEKVLFATDSPWSEVKKCVAGVHALPLSDKEKQAIFANNAKKLLSINYP